MSELGDEVYVLTPYAVFLHVLGDYGITTSHITPKMAEHMFEDLMEALFQQGYVGRKENTNA